MLRDNISTIIADLFSLTIQLAFLPLDTPSSFFVLHWLTFFNALTGIVLLLLSRGHYTLDVIIAYFVATRMW